MASQRAPAHSNSFSPTHSLSSAHRNATLIFVAMFGIGGGLLALLAATLFMFAETLLPHVVEFCLTIWNALSVQLAYRLMFLGLVILALSVLAFTARVTWRAWLTRQYVHKLLGAKQGASAKLTRVLDGLELAACVDVVATAQPFAFSYGWRKPRVLITRGLVETLDEQELLSVLAHEKYHLEQHEPLKILIARALRDAIIFFPILNDLVENYVLLQEIAADQTALARGATREALASALLKVFRSPTWDALGVGAYSPFGERVQHLAEPHRKFNWRISWVRLLVSVVAVILLVLAVLHPMAPMALGEALHADCHHVAVLDINSGSLIHA